ncbi:MAG: nodulation protein NodN [Rhodospirillales bacterium 20-64-7]|nr:MAG: nodulation protein NodN [Rhodospirillales bacterium 20-64-7]
MRKPAAIADIQALVGKEVGVSGWVLVDQGRIDRFAEVTGDHQFIHVDPAAAARTPFGGTIAHGLLTLSLLPALAYEVLPAPAEQKMAANYGYNKIRFVAPVRSGKRVRARFTLLAFDEVKPGRWQQITAVTVEIEGEDKPALTAEWIGQSFTG